jgi:hypothetical protein
VKRVFEHVDIVFSTGELSLPLIDVNIMALSFPDEYRNTMSLLE